MQAIARDLLVTGMHAVAEAGHKIVMHVHDEIVIDEPADSGFTATDACELMSTLPTWAQGLPLDADGYECDYYRVRTREPRALVLASSRELQCERVEQWDCVDRC
ncbi:hypothetical protein CIP107578_02157 [Corynebacterium diphtheriae]|uniref:DNA polymerase n=1 Tax=Corynebacterium diphtheriae TaxID=1717 RepID=A0A811G630_CORDP|nr:hypothetical protein CIP107558_02151 [Corynebacterium diphtheriae]CAB0622654.1 hypothetical protein CIP107547_02361 [Corynebacterium diphtheriae]CAB0668421.1 hypothetical protein CIP107578_02157 [Corynebacterium diphtheriae]